MTDKIELRHLRYFVALAGERHFGRAAAALQVTQPLVSRQVRALEKLLGVPLLAQTRPIVQLSAAGTLFYQQAQEALQHVERAARAAQNAGRGKETIAIAFEPCSSFHGFANITRKLHGAIPEVRLEVHEQPVGEHAHGLRSGNLDIAYGHRGEPSEGIEFLTLSSEPLMAALSSGHRLARRREIDLTELTGEPFVLWPRSIAPACFDCILELVRSQGAPALEIRHTAPDHGKLLGMIASGLGWTVAPACVGRARQPGVTFRHIRGVATQVDLGLSYLAGNRSRTVRKVIEVWKKI